MRCQRPIMFAHDENSLASIALLSDAPSLADKQCFPAFIRILSILDRYGRHELHAYDCCFWSVEAAEKFDVCSF